MSRYLANDPAGWLTRCREARYPLEPLVEELDRRGLHTESERAESLKVTRKTWHRWRAANELTDRQADTAACAIGLHPLSLWPEYGEDLGV